MAAMQHSRYAVQPGPGSSCPPRSPPPASRPGLPPIGLVDDAPRRSVDLKPARRDHTPPPAVATSPCTDYPPHPRPTSYAPSAYPSSTPAPASAPTQDRSLPSIHEALGAPPSPPKSYAAAPTAAPPARSYYPYTAPSSTLPASPLSASSTHPPDRAPEQESAARRPSYSASYPPPSAPPSYRSYPPAEHRSSGPPQPPQQPLPSHSATYSPAAAHPPSSYRSYPANNSAADRHYALSEAAPYPAHPSYGQTPPQPPAQHHAPRVRAHDVPAHPDAPHAHRVDAVKLEHAPPVYGDNVKRHLDSFDLEAALNDIGEASRALHEFSHHYSQKAHLTQRSGPLPGSTPTLDEIENMHKQAHGINVSLQRLRDVVHSQQVALAERSKEAQIKAASVIDGAAAVHPGPAKDGFAGADAKKRRGRAAPPGRCHSCNRAETPEWRRGPDGARTLCNACGLHYAKLTRKMASNKAATGSNLQPKTVAAASPT